MSRFLLVAAAFFLMEPVIYVSHRFVMHGRRGWAIHKSHHQANDGGFELNDLYPLGSAAVTVMGMAAGASFPRLDPLLWVGTGVTVYGLAYVFVHDVSIHRRLRWLSVPPVGVLEYLTAAHRIHHLYGGEPYGMLFPIVPAELWERAAVTSADPFAREAARPARA